ncbi:hypothetical protein CFK37_16645 [Virgibacillus phasianinus]|uniref:Uncharacterized protein n=1 Tax=Virgibacillus phasianinus TaxID=2017483 RepID=A0A220U6E9_9BACI|nr:hypothetical protein [Virgibacillus phasianinus]ASK63670.1 hypothetical protein CFK37_16645 [Virgibacillus phasianinus]
MNIKKLILSVVSIMAIVILISSWNGFGRASLVANQMGKAKFGDFILHIRVEEVNEEIKVFRSLQYMGEDPIEIKHQTPLISISLGRRNHDFTGSNVKEEMKHGDSYYPQKAKIITIPKKGKYTLYCLASFQVEGKDKKIEHSEELIFQ